MKEFSIMADTVSHLIYAVAVYAVPLGLFWLTR
jgi:hypothetical protein